MAVTLLSTSVYKELEHVHFYAAEKHCGQRHPDRAVHGAAEHLFARAREVRRKPDMANVSERAPRPWSRRGCSTARQSSLQRSATDRGRSARTHRRKSFRLRKTSCELPDLAQASKPPLKSPSRRDTSFENTAMVVWTAREPNKTKERLGRLAKSSWSWC